jgi:hypothetical protein
MKPWLIYAVCVLLVSIALFRSAKNMPVVEVVAGQALYSIDAATAVVVTGYRIPRVRAQEADYRNVVRPANNPAVQETLSGEAEVTPGRGRRDSRTKSGHTVEQAALSSEKAAAANSRTRPAPTVEQKRPEKTSPSDELLNPYIIENLVRSSDKTYYFTEKSLTRSGVTVELLSMTPRKTDYFLKFRITNAGKDYFIPQAFAVKHGDDWVDSEKFFKYMLQAQESQIGYLRVKAAPAAKDKMFQLNESGGGFRKYSIFY